MDDGGGSRCFCKVTAEVNTKEFMGLRSRRSLPHLCRFFAVPIPYEKSTSYGRGTGGGPAAVIKASGQLELWDEEIKAETWKLGICTLAPFKTKNISEEVFFRKLEQEAARLSLAGGAVPFFIGGEHSFTQALVPPFIKKYPKLSVLHFDAHADLRPSYEERVRSHACALFPVSQKCRVVQIGIRSVAPEEKRYINSGNVKTFFMHDNRNIKQLIRKTLAALSDTVYLTIDADGFDPSVIPGTGTPQPGGFGWHEALDIFSAVCRNKKVVGADVVEISPMKGSSVSEFAAAKLIYRLMGYIAKTRRLRAGV